MGTKEIVKASLRTLEICFYFGSFENYKESIAKSRLLFLLSKLGIKSANSGYATMAPTFNSISEPITSGGAPSISWADG